jgi:hypothetical protein
LSDFVKDAENAFLREHTHGLLERISRIIKLKNEWMQSMNNFNKRWE